MRPLDPMDSLPLRQLVVAGGSAATAFASQGILDWLSRPQRYRFLRYGAGGQILANDERALREARSVLRQAYGPCIDFGAPTVHTFVDTHGETLMVPVVLLRIDAPSRCSGALHRLLERRQALVVDLELRDRVILRAEVNLLKATGLESQVAAIAGGDAHIVSWLVRYERAGVPREETP